MHTRKVMRIVSLILVAVFLSLTVLVINPLRTLASLRLVDGHYLYVMDYHGSYFLDTFLHQRIDRKLAQIQRNIGRGGASTSFAAIDPRGDMLLARNYDWFGNESILLYTYPTDAYSSVSMVSIGGM